MLQLNGRPRLMLRVPKNELVIVKGNDVVSVSHYQDRQDIVLFSLSPYQGSTLPEERHFFYSKGEHNTYGKFSEITLSFPGLNGWVRAHYPSQIIAENFQSSNLDLLASRHLKRTSGDKLDAITLEDAREFFETLISVTPERNIPSREL